MGLVLSGLARDAGSADADGRSLDEADRLVDMGFEEQVSKIIKLLDRKAEQGDRSSRRQTVMLSATMHSGVTRLARFSLNNPESVGFDPDGSGEGGAEGGREFKMPEKLTTDHKPDDPEERRRIEQCRNDGDLRRL